MRLILAAALALGLAAPALAADEVPAGAEPAIAAVNGVLKSTKSVRYRKLKVEADGDVCGVVVASAAASDLQFTWSKSTGLIWINEAPTVDRSDFVWGAPNLKRSTEREDYKLWKACQAG